MADDADAASGIGGPTVGAIKANDRLLPEELVAAPIGLKGLLAQVYISLKRRAFVQLLGRHWRAKARWKRSRREAAALAAARAVVSGDGSIGGAAAAAAAAAAGADSAGALQLPAAPALPVFRAAGTLGELLALMRQATAELPFYQ
ncbi:hypothetical protein MNEG_16096 [Monoraphidium neglectum]|uniref:Uncharacterized protein n=1 Tax=Monoraphidium neglectum TaxID=145388 RepID=A0A0D2IV75_9CHLO|nr:hypothetical protein MNEG_16096 [Monoraphidium neglectum]KIY91867.1 hypothetical protein MNEG_16096 [Monoraphidium neglectum]|eukprot:XP_013890887.1 hypothetical protein MNEG_16096 [Monoraphidium neglectum]